MKRLSIELAEAHVDWYLKSIRPLLIDHMVHGFKHGVEYVSAQVVTQQDASLDRDKSGMCPYCGVGQILHKDDCPAIQNSGK